MIAIIDYGLGNLLSIQNMLKHLEIDSIITNNKDEIAQSSHLIIPGVGKFDEGMRNLQERNLDTKIKEEAMRGKPVLGICLGMQLLGKSSEEGEKSGLGLIDFKTIRFRFDGTEQRKIPHMGWERVKIQDCPLTKGLDDRQRFYFVHSYHALCDKKETSIIYCEYGYEFTAAVREKNVYGVQFHPEKSHRYGMYILKNFSEIR